MHADVGNFDPRLLETNQTFWHVPTPTSTLPAEHYAERIAAMLDVTTLSSSDTPEKVDDICYTAREVLPGVSAAAVCVYPHFMKRALYSLQGTKVNVAIVVGGFPDGLDWADLAPISMYELFESGAEEVDLVIPRYMVHQGRFEELYEWISKWVITDFAPTKVILSTAEIGDPGAIYKASITALQAGADFIKTSTGKGDDQASLELAVPMLHALKDYERSKRRKAGFKAAGGVRTLEQAVAYLKLAEEILQEKLDKDRFRIGASALVEDLRTKYALFRSSN